MSLLIKTENNLQTIEDEYKTFILDQEHPCIMAKTLFMMNTYHLESYDSLNDTNSLCSLLDDLENYINQYDFESKTFESFIAVFPNDSFETELQFERTLWRVLQQLHELDDCEWDATVSDNPDDSGFSFSLKGKAFYIVGLHPNSSRLARQSPYTTIVFNLHCQFDKLRDMGTYQGVRDRIRKRDKQLQGSINPVLKDFGTATESRQYSGRNVEEDWTCPFHKNN